MPTKAAKLRRRTPKQERSASTVECILDATAQVLLREGYARTTTNRIAERAGISVGSLYQYFEDKDAIFDALLKEFFGRMIAAISEDPIDPSRPLKETFRRLAILGLSVWPRGPEILHHLEQTAGTVVRNRARRAKMDFFEVLRSVADAHRDELRVRGKDLDIALALMIGAAEGMFYDLSHDADTEHIAGEVAIMFSRYLEREG